MRLAPLLVAAVGACASPVEEPPPAPVPPLALAPGWHTVAHPAFTAWLDRELPEKGSRALDPHALDELAAALDSGGEHAVRAAVVLGRSRTHDAALLLLEHLERRLLADDRAGDAADVVAAAALATHPESRAFARDLRGLATGPDPHPDLEVRVECAVAALANGEDAVAPFLLRVLYLGTWRDREATRDFEDSPTTAWVRGRAARALSERAGVPCAYRYDAPLADREREADRLAALLGLEPLAP